MYGSFAFALFVHLSVLQGIRSACSIGELLRVKPSLALPVSFVIPDGVPLVYPFPFPVCVIVGMGVPCLTFEVRQGTVPYLIFGAAMKK